ncbi:hypothetical protein CERSUDRAFT_112857 [Gelatoporia subvermispora B]|uniref:Dienelactone hydrolase domain-containing protein n=1 Tax=Ceriporiopsis subvermispora (strain B) TaxID=914234 RepID=M2QQ30_CERS8|nr:hypothetical protein CERSUDRAFT_112857 [Gelatoporia subvermispora B]
MSLCKHCVSGVRHEGSAEGKIETIGGIESYVATPTVDYPKDKVLLVFTDILGIHFNNTQLIADDFARNGFKTIVPDILAGEPIPEEALDSGKFDVAAWIGRHQVDVYRPIIDKVIAALKEQGITTFATTGFCYGARPAFDLAFENITAVTVVNHPSLLQVPADLEKYRDLAKAPILINSCEIDPQFPKEAQEKADGILGGGKFAPGYERTYWDGCTHGFAIRGDLSNPKVKTGKEGAFKASVEFLIKHL